MVRRDKLPELRQAQLWSFSSEIIKIDKFLKTYHERCKIESRNSRRIFVCKCVQTFGKRDFRFCDLEFAYDQRTGYNVRIIKERRK